MKNNFYCAWKYSNNFLKFFFCSIVLFSFIFSSLIVYNWHIAAAVYGVAQSWTWLKWLSSSSSSFFPREEEQLLGQREELTGRCGSSFWWWLPSHTIPVSVLCALHTSFSSGKEAPLEEQDLGPQWSAYCTSKPEKPEFFNEAMHGKGVKASRCSRTRPHQDSGLDHDASSLVSWPLAFIVSPHSPSSLTRGNCLKQRNWWTWKPHGE